MADSGTSHDTRYNLIEYYEGRGEEDLKRIEISNGWKAEGLLIDCPYEPIFNAAFHHLYNWARYGIPAPRAPKIETEIVIDLEETLTRSVPSCTGPMYSVMRWAVSDIQLRIVPQALVTAAVAEQTEPF